MDGLLEKTKAVAVLLIYISVCAVGFNLLIVQQENILKKYFITNPQERIREANASLADSLSKYFVRENSLASLEQVADYVRKYGSTSLFDLIFIFRDKDGGTKQISKLGLSPVTKDAFASEKVYPVSVANGGIQGYLLVLIKESGSAELEEGLNKYKRISYSLRFLFILVAAALVAIIFYHRYSAKMKLARDIAEIKAANDGLTGLYTHEYFMKILNIEIEKFGIYNTPVALLMLDIDQFKLANDRYSHLAGNRILQEVARIIKYNTRSTDIAARYGGEEFAIIVPYVARIEETPDATKKLESFINEVRSMAERIRESVQNARIEFPPHTINVTISIGGAFYHKRTERASSHGLIKKADAALYKAKESGRNRVLIDYESSRDLPR
jgi:diguanylate cyclase (GGDEF)-like protein